ncbi:hypothetical protein ACFL6I_10265 [candidate division KSB1 bacterium]
MIKLLLIFLFILILLCSSFEHILSQFSGLLDNTFGDNGVNTISIAIAEDGIRSITFQSDKGLLSVIIPEYRLLNNIID